MIERLVDAREDPLIEMILGLVAIRSVLLEPATAGEQETGEMLEAALGIVGLCERVERWVPADPTAAPSESTQAPIGLLR